MSPSSGLRSFFARIARWVNSQPRLARPVTTLDFQRACKELAFWAASDAGLIGPVEAFDGSVLHPAADGLFTLRMTLHDSLGQRPVSDAATIILRSIEGLRLLLLLDIDGHRFTYVSPQANPGVRDMCANYTNRTQSTG